MGTALHGSFLDYPETRHSKYIIVTGGSLGEAWMAPTILSQLVAEGRTKGGLKVVVIDPRQTRAAAKADEWIPIRPGTDLALFLAMMHVLVHELGVYDQGFLRGQTNAVYLIGEDGYPLRDKESNKPLVWDAGENKAKTFDDTTVKDYALEGCYRVDNAAGSGPAGAPPEGRTGFQLFKDTILQYTPEWASEMTTIPVTTIRRLTKEIAEAAQIGSTIVLDGKEYAYRPVAVAGYRGTNCHTNSPKTEQARIVLNMLLGSNRAPGGVAGFETDGLSGIKWRCPYPADEDGMTVGTYTLEPHSPWKFPFEDVGMKAIWGGGMSGMHHAVLGQVDPKRYGVDEDYLCECLMHWRINALLSTQDPKMTAQALAKIPFFVDITLWLDEADDFADLVLPDVHWLERLSAFNMTWFFEGINLQQPVVPPMYKSMSGPEVYLELARRMGIMTGPMGMFAMANYGMDRWSEPWVVPIDTECTYEEYVDSVCKGLAGHDLDWFKEHGHNLELIPPDRFYYRWGWNQYRLPFYWYKLKADGDALRANMERDKVGETADIDVDYFCQQFDPIPVWYPALIHSEDPKYDMYAVSGRGSIFHHSTLPSTNPWLIEIAERDPVMLRVLINSETAREKGLEDDDLVWVESRAGKVKGRLRTTDCVHREVLGFYGPLGHWMKHELAEGKGSHHGSLLPMDMKTVAPVVPALEASARVRVDKAAEGGRK
jgi:molybdopterin-containing oxidoreductase family molybdopterin binding subunit